ncbi:AaceriAAL165Wp [[Ashbya] aceris (nom. inval.)]|nr:AaceriAAL165Wp [[Ashbya] aceris (nom. inval.)]
MSRLDPGKQNLEVKSLDPNHSRLNPEASRLRINDIIKDLSINHAHPVSPQANTLTVLSSVFKNCDEQVLLQSLVSNSYFWCRFFALVAKYAYSNSLLHASLVVLRATEHMLLTMKGVPSDTLKTYCDSFHGNLNIISIFAGELMGSGEASKINMEIIRVVGNYIACLNKLAKKSASSAALAMGEIYLTMRTTGFLTAISYLIEESSDDKLYDSIVKVFVTPLRSMKIFMTANHVSEATMKLSKELNSTVESAFYLNKAAKEQFLAINEDYSDPTAFTLLQIVDAITILRDDNLSLKKRMAEQLMFDKHPFPLLAGCVGVTDMLFSHFSVNSENKDVPRYITQMMLNKDAVMFAVVHKLTLYWSSSKAKNSEDLVCLLALLKHLMDKVDSTVNSNAGVDETPIIEKTLDIINSMSYESLRQLQLKQVKAKHYQKWNQYGSNFNAMLSHQVEDYVRQQRIYQLQTGTWVYAEDPTSDRRYKHPKVFFLVLSDNHNNLLAREFKYRIEKPPTVDQNEILTNDVDGIVGNTTIVIPLKRVTDFQSRELKLNKELPKHRRLINITSKAVFTEVQLMGKNTKPLITFYLDNRDASFIWLDGLQLLASSQKKPKLSKSTKSQIDTLIDIRKNIQLIGLSDYNFSLGYNLADSEEEQYYDIDTLSTLTEDFFYD